MTDSVVDEPAAPRAGGEPATGRRGLTVQGRVNLLLAGMVALVLVFAAVGGSLLSRTAAISNDLVDRVSPARSAVARLQAALLDQEVGVRGYLLTGNRQFLEPYARGQAAERTESGNVLALMGDRSVQAADVAAVRQAAAAWRSGYAEPAIAAVQAGRPGDAPRTESGKQAFDRIRGLLAGQSAHIDQVRADARAELDRIRAQRNWAFAAMLAAFLVAGLAIALLFHRSVGRPLQALCAASRQVASGDFHHRIPAQGPSDIRQVAEDVDAMRRRIVHALAEAEKAREILTKQAADLDLHAAELRRSNAELEQFAYVASHDLQEPLRKVASFCQMLEKRYADKLDDRARQYIGFAVDGAKRMQVLINDLLTFSRVGRLNDVSEPVSLATALRAAQSNLAPSIEESEARVEVPDDLPQVMADPTLLIMLWQNLIGNSIKFRHPDRLPVVRVECARESDGAWRLCVTDNGIGIPAEFSDKVFVIFQRLHSRDAYGGTGIGLALCKKIVEYYGGRIWLDTDRAEGARICFTLPAIPPDPAGAPDDEAREPHVPTPEGSPA
ncbi:sensor histidine kinase [Bailinhaonella thermotolerans]|uniref:histidine kinase n=1 Tax=Bailinhaonella thermotolerans TaxID=1070861 RepID=A0A3A4AYK2_9ACTN|nr:sensor histidine kinase [Bailinhaonella thermotolerans]RJL24452.1 HAMP domain-containing protein [Bailinhaonella thermotolerans]